MPSNVVTSSHAQGKIFAIIPAMLRISLHSSKVLPRNKQSRFFQKTRMTLNKMMRRKETIVLLFISFQFLEASIKMVLEAKQLLQLNVRITPHFKGHKTVSENGIFLHHFVSDYLGL